MEHSDVERDSGVPWPGVGNIHANPLFSRPLLDFQLSLGSPCLDVGDNTKLPQDWLDLDDDGKTGTEQIPWCLTRTVPRVVDVDPNAPPTFPVVDMGAQERKTEMPL